MFLLKSPIDGQVLAERTPFNATQLEQVLANAAIAQRVWRNTPLETRLTYCERMLSYMLDHADEIGEELTKQMGRPIRYTPNEIRRGFQERARYMMQVAPEALQDTHPSAQTGFTRFIRREPVGTVLVIAPWNYPYLTAVNAIVPALLAGNSVILKHSVQTLLCGERLAKAFEAAGLPVGLFQVIHASHEAIAHMITDERIGFVAFTGSVAGGHAIQAAAAKRFIGTGLELGGKDPAYVREDAHLDHAIAELVDGAFFNSGQSCCGIERIYVHERLFTPFVEGFVALTRQYKLGNPLDPETTLGPMIHAQAADFVRQQRADALAQGAIEHLPETDFAASKAGSPYLAPIVLTKVHHGMRVMREESFGPIIGIMPVKDDAEALAFMNDSPYGLTASIWTQDAEAALQLSHQIETGTCFMNRCDYLDPALAWTGVKDTGHGCTLSVFGFDAFTRHKSFHFKHLP